MSSVLFDQLAAGGNGLHYITRSGGFPAFSTGGSITLIFNLKINSYSSGGNGGLPFNMYPAGGTGSPEIYLVILPAGTAQIGDTSGNTAGRTYWADGYTGGAWIALTMDGALGATGHHVGYVQREDGVFNTAFNVSGQLHEFDIGDFTIGSAPLFASFCANSTTFGCIKMFSGVLSPQEIQAEFQSRTPVNWNGLLFWNPCLDSANVNEDHSGHLGDFTFGAGVLTTSTFDPGVPWTLSDIDNGSVSANNQGPAPSPNIVPAQLVPVTIGISDLALDPSSLIPSVSGRADLGIGGAGLTPSSIQSADLAIVALGWTPATISGSDLALDMGSMSPGSFGVWDLGLSPGSLVPGALGIVSLSTVPFGMVPVGIPNASLVPGINPTSLVPVGISGSSLAIDGQALSVVQVSLASLSLVGSSFGVSAGAGSSFDIVPIMFSASAPSLGYLSVVPVQLSPVLIVGFSITAGQIAPIRLDPVSWFPASLDVEPIGMDGASISQFDISANDSLPSGVQRMPSTDSIVRLPYDPVTIETIDTAIRDWFDRTVDVHVTTPTRDRHKVRVMISSGERFAASRRDGVRDRNGVLVLPLISIRRTGIVPDPGMQALGTETPTMTISRCISGKTSAMRNLERVRLGSSGVPEAGALFEVITIPFPDRSIMGYEVVVWAQYITQMNEILEKIFNQLDIQKSFVATIDGGRKHPPLGVPFEERPRLPGHYVVGFFESEHGDSGNFEEFTDVERIVRYTTSIRVPATLQLDPEGERPAIQVEHTAFGLRFSDETVHLVDDPAELDRIFGGRPR